MNLQKKFADALIQFVNRYEKDKNVIGIIVSGSYIHSKLDKNSDLDVQIILKKSTISERGNTWIGGIEIEYFIDSVKQINYYFKREKEGKDSPSTAHMFVNSKILLRRGNYLDNLIREAKIILKKKTPSINKYDKEYLKYFIDDSQKDLEDVYIKKDYFTFDLVAYELINLCLEGFYKIKRISRRKPKTLRIYLRRCDKNFERLFSQVIVENDFSKKFGKINKLVDYTENLLGGKRQKEWKLKTKCVYNKK